MSKIIVAVDGISFQHAVDKGIFKTLKAARDKGLIWGIKINDMLYTGNATKIIAAIKDDYGLGIMADVKLHDIPNTMTNSINKLVAAGANIITVHCSSNYRPKNHELLNYLAGVTVLTSFTDLEIKWIYDKKTEEVVKAFSDIALMNGYSYIVSSVRELAYIQDNPLKKICTGIRPSWASNRHDQVRIATVKEAIRMEIDFIVVGRPIMESQNIMKAIEMINEDIG